MRIEDCLQRAAAEILLTPTGENTSTLSIRGYLGDGIGRFWGNTSPDKSEIASTHAGELRNLWIKARARLLRAGYIMPPPIISGDAMPNCSIFCPYCKMECDRECRFCDGTSMVILNGGFEAATNETPLYAIAASRTSSPEYLAFALEPRAILRYAKRRYDLTGTRGEVLEIETINGLRCWYEKQITIVPESRSLIGKMDARIVASGAWWVDERYIQFWGRSRPLNGGDAMRCRQQYIEKQVNRELLLLFGPSSLGDVAAGDEDVRAWIICPLCSDRPNRECIPCRGSSPFVWIDVCWPLKVGYDEPLWLVWFADGSPWIGPAKDGPTARIRASTTGRRSGMVVGDQPLERYYARRGQQP